MTPTRRALLRRTGGVAALSLLPGWFRPALAAETLSERFARLETELAARLGACVLDTGNGQVWSRRADQPFPMCSTFKAVAAAALLARADAGRERMSRRVVFSAADLVPYSPVTGPRVGGDGMTLSELCAAAVTVSDNTAANLILNAIGGPAGFTAFVRSLGDGVTRLDRREPDLNQALPGDPRDTTTPAAMAGLLRALLLDTVLSPAARRQLADWMIASTTGATKLRAGLPPDWRIGDKTGSGGHGTANVVAAIWPPGRAPLIVAVLITETEAPMAARDAAMAEIGRAVAAAL